MQRTKQPDSSPEIGGGSTKPRMNAPYTSEKQAEKNQLTHKDTYL